MTLWIDSDVLKAAIIALAVLVGLIGFERFTERRKQTEKKGNA